MSLELYDDLYQYGLRYFRKGYYSFKDMIDYESIINYSLGKACATYKPNYNTTLKTYFITILSNDIKMELRRINRISDIKFLPMDHVIFDNGDCPLVIGDILLDNHEEEVKDYNSLLLYIEEFSHTLKPKEKEILYMRISGMTLDSIAHHFGNHYQYIQRVMKRISKSLQSFLSQSC